MKTVLQSPTRAASELAASVAGDAIECEVRAASPKPLHIACALGGTDLGNSGIGTYVRELLPRLAARTASAGGTLTVFGHAAELDAYAPVLSDARQRRVAGVPLRAAFNATWYLLRAGAFARRLGAEVLLLPAGNRRIASAAGLPVVAVIHDLAQLRVEAKYDWLRMTYFRHVLLPAFRRPRRLVAVSAATRDDLVSLLGIPVERVRVVYNGVNSHRFRAAAPESAAIIDARRATGLDARRYLLYPARLEHPGKNHVRLLTAFARSGLAASHVLALTGADWGAGQLLHDLTRQLGLEAAVRFVGFVPADRLPALVAGADAVLMLGLHEGFGLPALEGLSAGRPVCVSATGALPEVVGPLGVKCDPLSEQSIAQALVQVVTDDFMRTRCEREGPVWAQRFSWDRTADGILDACQEAVAAD